VESREARAHNNDTDAIGMRRDGSVDHEDSDVRTQGTCRGAGVDDIVVRRDSARWGPIWAGLITALTTFLLLELLAIGVGLQDVGPGAGGGDGWVPAIIGLIASFTGGAVAGMTSAVRGASTGLLNGFLVWALGTTLILVLSALGLGQIFGALGNLVGQLGVLQNGVIAPDVTSTPPRSRRPSGTRPSGRSSGCCCRRWRRLGGAGSAAKPVTLSATWQTTADPRIEKPGSTSSRIAPRQAEPAGARS
jgi:hypothetical protein